jgi:hypothetical protein
MLTACGASGGGTATGLATLPGVTLAVAGAQQVEGYPVDFCLPNGCTETERPTYASSEFIPFPSGNRVDVNINGPIPTEVTISLLPYANGLAGFDPVDSITLTPQSTALSWQPNVSPGLYVLDVYGQWGDYYAGYWFPVSVQP